ncbi:MAG: ABC transporter substrate-binding protein [Betaproteobacteria bacterium]|nr:ABC transporter substrate-binding protein [Betaproteobacteria bacterium]
MNTRRNGLSVAGLLAALFVVFSFSGGTAMAQSAAGAAKEKVQVRFTWKLKGEYAPLFVALDKGYFAAEGLDVDLAEGQGAQTVLRLLAAGTENIGYGPAVAAAQAVSQNMPVKVAALYQTRAPMGVISFPDVPLKTPKDLEGKRIGISVGETFTDMLEPFTKINKIDLSRITRIQMDNSARTSQFLSRKVDVMSVYLSNELPVLEQRTGVKFNVMKVADFGLNLLGASYYISNNFARQNPGTVAKLMRATAKGYADAMKDPKGAAEIMNKYMKVKENPDVLLAQVKATVESTNAPTGRPIGWQSENDWKTCLDLLMATGAIKERKDIGLYYTNDFLK